MRELKEETGYIGEVQSVSPLLCMSPGMSNEMVEVVTVRVDLGLAANQLPTQQLEEGERTTVIIVEKGALLEELRRMDAEDGVQVFFGLYCLAFGLATGTGTHGTSSRL